MPEETPPGEPLVCEECGQPDAFRIAGRVLCASCYQACGSCCPEFGKDDLWEFPDEVEPPPEKR